MRTGSGVINALSRKTVSSSASDARRSGILSPISQGCHVSRDPVTRQTGPGPHLQFGATPHDPRRAFTGAVWS